VAYSLRAMSNTTSTRPRGSRFGLVLFLALLGLGVWEIIGRATPFVRVTPLGFARAAWGVASGHGASPLGGPSDEEMANLAYRPLPYVMFGLKPEWTRRNQVRKSDGAELRKTTNRLGFRGRDIEIPKPAERTRVVCLGGSTTYGDGTDDDHTYPALLEQELLKARPGRDIEVINAGVLSYTTAETLPNLAFRCLDFEPDVIVLYEGINDVRPRRYADFDSAYFHYRKIWDGTASAFEKGEGDMGGGINCFIQHLPPPGDTDVAANQAKAGTAAFRRNLASIAGIAKAHGIAVVMVSCVSDPAPEADDPALVAGIVEHNGVVRDVAAEQGALFIDMAARYQGAGQFTDLVHMNDEGSLQMARLVAEGLLKGTL
jgi:lysophospholipase L1-like esterase